MNKTYKEFLVIRPRLPEMVEHDGMPYIKANEFKDIKSKTIKLTNFKNYKSILDKKNTIIDMFNYDDVLNSIWNDPLKYVAKFQNLYAVSTPDFSVYPGMNKYEYEHNVYKSRWIRSLWQSMGLNVIPTISWGDESTYEVCFKGIQKGSIVIISTLGVSKNKDVFIRGYNEMVKVIEPSLIMVVGKLYKEMDGEFLLFGLGETFSQTINSKQLKLFEINNYVKQYKGERIYG